MLRNFSGGMEEEVAKISMLHLLAASDSEKALQAVRAMLESGRIRADRVEVNGLTALHVAAAYDNRNMCKLLLSFGANPLQKDDFQRYFILIILLV